MDKAISILTELEERLQREYEVAVQTANIIDIAYLEGVISGVDMAIEELNIKE